MKKKKMELIRKSVEDFLTENNILYNTDKDGKGFLFSFDTDSKIADKFMLILLEVTDSGFVAETFVDKDIKDENVTQVAEYLTRVNNTIIDGCFQMNMDNRDIKFNMSVSIYDAAYDKDIIDYGVSVVQYIFNTYGDGLEDVISGKSTAEEAFSEAYEKAMEEE